MVALRPPRPAIWPCDDMMSDRLRQYLHLLIPPECRKQYADPLEEDEAKSEVPFACCVRHDSDCALSCAICVPYTDKLR